jgi:hypothetical protein
LYSKAGSHKQASSEAWKLGSLKLLQKEPLDVEKPGDTDTCTLGTYTQALCHPLGVTRASANLNVG